jgi:2-haloacid dehalogenase
VAYSHVLLDLDHTLLDSDTSLVQAFGDAMAVAGADPAGQYAVFDEINHSLWRAVERGELTPQHVHVERFARLIAALDLGADPEAMAVAFADGLGAHGELYPGARELLEELASVSTLALVTNGLSNVQRARVDRLAIGHYFDAVIISAEVGVAKPAVAIFDATFDALGRPDRAEAVMVGDNLSSDIAGGNNYGISTCWYNPNALPSAAGYSITYEIASLDQLRAIVGVSST